MELVPFAPKYGSGQTLATSGSSASVSLGAGNKCFCLSNLGSYTIYVRVGDSSATATIADYPVLSNSQITISKEQDYNKLAAISPDGASSLHILQGEGF
jgi:hypothetical protein